jgi:phenylacetate-CoA ligase
MNYSPEAAFKSKEQIKLMQEKKLQEAVSYLNEHSPFYKDLFTQARFNVKGIKTIEDLSVIPVTIKENLQQHNDSFLCVPLNKIIEYSSTSGTLGSPVTIFLTENDLERLTYNEYSSFVSAGGSSNDIYQLMLTMDRQFMAGMAYYSGIVNWERASSGSAPAYLPYNGNHFKAQASYCCGAIIYSKALSMPGTS